MNCEICGRTIERAVEAEVEGVVMKVCGGCARFGTAKKRQPPKASGAKPKRFASARSPPVEKVLECVDGYNELIRKAREKKEMTREDLGKVMNEKVSVIARLESGTMVPNTKLARKIENILGIKILEVQEGGKVSGSSSSSGEMTIGDLMK